MASNVIELRTPKGTENLEQLLDQVTIKCPEDIHDAAENLARISQERGMQVAVCDDISSKEPMVDAMVRFSTLISFIGSTMVRVGGKIIVSRCIHHCRGHAGMKASRFG